MPNGLRLTPTHYQIAALGWMLVIFYFSHQPGSGEDEVLAWLPGYFKNLLHFPVFGLLAVLIWRGIRDRFDNTILSLGITLLLVLLYGAFDEWHQSFIEGRFSTLSDVRNDVIGAVVALSALLAWEQWNKRRALING